MTKATTIKEALKKWEETHKSVAIEAKDIGLQFQWPPIEKMDVTLSTLTKCEKLSLSSNMIEKIVGVSGLKHLKILSLARNNLKTLNGIESLSETLEELWISYNLIEKVKGIENMKKIKVLYIGNNLIKEWSEYNKFNALPLLEDLLFVGNPLAENLDEQIYKVDAIKRLPLLKKLDGETIIREDADED